MFLFIEYVLETRKVFLMRSVGLKGNLFPKGETPEADLCSRNDRVSQRFIDIPKLSIYHMEERTGCFAIGQQPVFKKTCINLHISISTDSTKDAMKRKKNQLRNHHQYQLLKMHYQLLHIFDHQD